MRLLILVLLLGGISVFVLQNREPVTLVFFGSNKTTLPIAFWVLSFTGAGAMTSVLWQILNRSGKSSNPSTTQRVYPKSPDPFPPSSRVQDSGVRPRQQEWRSPMNSPPSRAESDWETEDKEDWNIEQAPIKEPEPNPPRDNFERSLKEDVATNFEAQQQPKTVSHTGSVYSYGYREAKNQEQDTGKTDQVYDANYRVITPPYRENTKPNKVEDEEEEDWI